MNARGESKAKISVLLAVILIAGYFIVRQVAPPADTGPLLDWACERCDYRFTAPPSESPRVCPECRGDAVRSHIYYDISTGELVELYRSKPNPDFDEDVHEWQMDRYIKVPGGEWGWADGDYYLEEGLPVRVDRPGDYLPAPPNSQYRTEQ